MTRRTILPLLLLSFILPAAFAGQTQQSPAKPQSSTPQPGATPERDDVVRITTNLVQVDAVVTKDGKPVNNLTAQDFEVYEDGRKQEITSFAFISNIPKLTPPVANSAEKNVPFAPFKLNPNDPHRTIALVVDDLGLSAESMSQVRRQLRKFVAEKIGPNDLVAIIRTGGVMGALQQFTNDRRMLDKALEQVRWNICGRVGISVLPRIGPLEPMQTSSVYGPCGGAASVGNTLRALRFILDAMGELPGRKSMIIFSDSLPREEQEFNFTQQQQAAATGAVLSPDNTRDYGFLLQRIAEKAIRSSVVIYAVDAGGLQYTGLTAADMITGSARQATAQINNIMSARSRMILDRREGADLIAKQTGGFLVRNSNNFDLDRILEDQSGYYLLGYRPSDETFDKRFHHIKAKVKRSGMSLRTRFGFFGVSEDEASKSKRTIKDNTLLALMSPFRTQEINLGLTAFFANDAVTGSMVRSFVYLNAKDLTFTEDATGWHKAQLRLRGIIFGNNGTVVNDVTHDRILSLRGDTYEAALRDGFSVQFDMPVKHPGAYQVRVAAVDITASHIGAAGQFVSVPDLSNKRLAISGIVVRGIVTTNGQGANISNDSGTGPAVRRFPLGSSILFTGVVYNALTDAAGRPNLSLEGRLFRDGKVLYTSAPMVVDVANQQDLSRIVASGVVRLDPNLEPGVYYLQLTITDALADKKVPPAVQWIDFEAVK